MTRPRVPQSVLDAAHARKAARAAGDWDEADRLRVEIEGAGWRVSDRGVDFALVPAHPPDVTEDGRTRYGSSESVPSRQAEPSAAPATVIVRATDRSVEHVVAALPAALPGDAQLVVIADDPAPAVATELERLAAAPDPARELVWTSARLGPAASLNIGLRRARGSILVVPGPGIDPAGDILAPLEAALAGDDVAVVGVGGLVGRDVWDLRPAPPGDVAALDGQCLAVRRELALARGALDERFATWALLATWWTLVLRDAGAGQPPWRALALDELPVTLRGGFPEAAAEEDPRLIKRDRYRLLDRFGARPDLFDTPPLH